MDSKTLLQWAAAELNGAKRLEAELLLCHVLHTSRALLLAHSTDEVTREQEAAFRQLVQRVSERRAAAISAGYGQFYGLGFAGNASSADSPF